MDIKKFKKIIESIDQEVLRNIDGDPELARSYLLDNEFSLETVRGSLDKELKKRKAAYLGQTKMKKDDTLLKRAIEQLKLLELDNKLNVSEVLRERLMELGLNFQFRNIKKWSDDEIKEILKDIDLIELLKNLEKDNSDDK